jgi:hypothetical protein
MALQDGIDFESWFVVIRQIFVGNTSAATLCSPERWGTRYALPSPQIIGEYSLHCRIKDVPIAGAAMVHTTPLINSKAPIKGLSSYLSVFLETCRRIPFYISTFNARSGSTGTCFLSLKSVSWGGKDLTTRTAKNKYNFCKQLVWASTHFFSVYTVRNLRSNREMKLSADTDFNSH